MNNLTVGVFRNDLRGPMQVVSGAIGCQRVPYEAPLADRLNREVDQFLSWLNGPPHEPDLIRAGMGYLWFVTLHPFDDRNGRIARAIGDLLLARADRSPQRFYRLSAQIQRERNDYYEVLERTQKGSLEITEWLNWFLSVLHRSIKQAHNKLDGVLYRVHFWQRISGTTLNERRVRLVNKLLDGFEGKLTTSKWASIAKCSPDTALRDINDLVALGVLVKSVSGGRSPSYKLQNMKQAC